MMSRLSAADSSAACDNPLAASRMPSTTKRKSLIVLPPRGRASVSASIFLKHSTSPEPPNTRFHNRHLQILKIPPKPTACTSRNQPDIPIQPPPPLSVQTSHSDESALRRMGYGCRRAE